MFLPASRDCGDKKTCANDYQCYAPQKECDEKADCLDQSDEWNCICQSPLSSLLLHFLAMIEDRMTTVVTPIP